MQITFYTDYSFRILIYLSWKNEQVTTIQEIYDFYQINKNHLTRIVHRLNKLGFIKTVRGKKGGVYLARSAESIDRKSVV